MTMSNRIRRIPILLISYVVCCTHAFTIHHQSLISPTHSVSVTSTAHVPFSSSKVSPLAMTLKESDRSDDNINNEQKECNSNRTVEDVGPIPQSSGESGSGIQKNGYQRIEDWHKDQLQSNT